MSDQQIILDVQIAELSETVVSGVSATVIGDFINQNSSSILSGTTFLETLSVNQLVTLRSDIIDAARDTVISSVADTRIEDFQVGFGIKSTESFSNDSVFGFIYDSGTIVGDVSFGESALNQTIDKESIQSALTFGESSLSRFLSPGSINSTESLETDHKILNNIVFDAGLSPTTSFGISTLELKLILNSIEPETAIGIANAFVSIGPEQIQSTETFGQPTFNNPVHRSLIFKEDKITKLGTNDDVEVASGIVVRTSTAQLTGSSVPGSAAGYITVTINGTDFAMPFFNLDDV